MKYLIIEDDELEARRLVSLISKLRPLSKITSCLISVESAIEWLGKNPNPDLIFLDIQLSDGVSFEIFETIELKIPVIFTTCYEKYALSAFRLNSIDYLIKPVCIDKLLQAIIKFESMQNIFNPDFNEDKVINLVDKYVLKKESYKSRFLIPHHDGYIPVFANNIAYFYAEDNCIMIKTKDSQVYGFHSSLDKLEKELDPEVFWRANRSFIVSVSSVKKAYNFFNYKVKLELMPATSKDVVVSRNKVSEFKRWFSH
jgi:DNA-binding LytR/AlgR family response regulator